MLVAHHAGSHRLFYKPTDGSASRRCWPSSPTKQRRKQFKGLTRAAAGQSPSNAERKSIGARVLSSVLSLSSAPYSSYVPEPKTFLHHASAEVKQLWTVAVLVIMARASLPVRLAIAGVLVSATMVALPRRLWQPQLVRLGGLCALLFFFTLIGGEVAPVMSNRSAGASAAAAGGELPASMAQLGATPYRYVLLQLGWITVTKRSLNLALAIAGLTFAALQAASLCLVTTPPESMARAVGRALSPLGLVGLPVKELVLTVLLALRFMATVFEECRNLCLGLASRGIDWRQQGLRGTLTICVGMGSRLFTNLMARCDNIAVAMAARGFQGPQRHVLYPMDLFRRPLMQRASGGAGPAAAGPAAGQQKPEPLEGHVRYQKIKDLNSGTFGFVQLALDRTTGRNVAIKFIERGDKVTKYVEREIINHRQLVHPHIIQFKEVFLTQQHLSIAMEYAAGGDMFEYVVRKGGLRESEARWFFQQLIVAVDYIHRMGVANRDIKLENTLLDGSPRPLIKICDFGYSKHEKYQSAPGSRVGTPAYLAPEVIMTTKGKTYDGKVADIWSCGVMLYVMVVGAYPFERPEDKHDNQKLQKMIQRILRVEYDWPAHIKLSPECRDLMARILVPDPTKRISIHEIQDHPWYMKDLPPGVKEMNDNMRMPPAGSQTEAEIRAVVQEAQKNSVMNPAGWEDDYIDDTMDAENYESSFDEWGAS
ncbi:hypothetical protein D9Q98_001038 [Chlorella vulgaris]|uniref:Protein kinase domain-containing protein n=1 Tax=Chlorella vulgaris TaxID=3077 RepID=A0A9D4TZV3_CHLVU|nr:hypothetical protein D9Q98_001038 [Chlorella vulgaris]